MRHLLNALTIITGRNEVLAKVIFLHLSVIHSVHGGIPDQAPPPGPGTPSPPGPGIPPGTRYTPQPGTPRDQVPPRDKAHPPGTKNTPLGRGTPPGTRHTPLGPGTHPPGTRHTPPPEQQTPKYGQRLAGTHPTGMHSCLILPWANHWTFGEQEEISVNLNYLWV